MSRDNRKLANKYDLAKRIIEGERQFGNWTFDPTAQTLEHAGGYWVPLNEMVTSANTLDYIFQIAGKSWASEEDIGYFIALLAATIDPQATLCSFGKDQRFDARSHLNRFFGVGNGASHG